jgi:methylated-DNA-[protein]-cysteine S-methyltransferase
LKNQDGIIFIMIFFDSLLAKDAIDGESGMKVKCCIRTPLGDMLAISDQGSLCGLWFIGQKHEPEDVGLLVDDPDNPVLTALRGQLDAYFAGQRHSFDLSLAPVGTAFQMEVWELLLSIPNGETTTYGALARQLAVRRGGAIPSAQAIGGAVGRNPISILIPCHRVIGANGSLTGYAGGLARKEALLALEKGKRL